MSKLGVVLACPITEAEDIKKSAGFVVQSAISESPDFSRGECQGL